MQDVSPIMTRSLNTEHYKSGMRGLASGVTIVATEHQGQRFGLASTAVTSVSADPPTLLVCVNKSASSHDALEATGCFTVNILHQGHKNLAELFGSPAGREKRFTTHRWEPMDTGAPALVGALVTFDCRVVQSMSFSSHTLFFGGVIAVRASNAGELPLLYWDREYRRAD
jgi:flavin reductase